MKLAAICTLLLAGVGAAAGAVRPLRAAPTARRLSRRGASRARAPRGSLRGCRAAAARPGLRWRGRGAARAPRGRKGRT
jgi:hypothetical protein